MRRLTAFPGDECGGPRSSGFDLCPGGSLGVRLRGSQSCLGSSEEARLLSTTEKLTSALGLGGRDAGLGGGAMQQHAGGELKELPAPQCGVSRALVRNELEPCSEGGAQRAADLHRHALQCEDLLAKRGCENAALSHLRPQVAGSDPQAARARSQISVSTWELHYGAVRAWQSTPAESASSVYGARSRHGVRLSKQSARSCRRHRRTGERKALQCFQLRWRTQSSDTDLVFCVHERNFYSAKVEVLSTFHVAASSGHLLQALSKPNH